MMMVCLRRLAVCSVISLMTLVCPPVVAAPAGAFEADIATILTLRKGLEAALQRVDVYALHMQTAQPVLPAEATRDELRATWYAFLDHIVALDAIGLRNMQLSNHLQDDAKSASFQLSYAAFLTEYRFALEFLRRTEGISSTHTLLNEPIVDFGLPAGTYAKFKFRFLNVLRASEFSWLTVRYPAHKIDTQLSPLIEDDARYILNVKQHGGAGLTLKNAGKVAADALFTAWFPMQKGVSEWMGDTKVLRHEKSLITDAQLQALQPRLLPGDILLVRREWYLSNIGLPGYWPHAALYIGTVEERQDYFSDNKTKAWVISQGEPSGNIEKLLAANYPTSYQSSQRLTEGELPRIVEAISEGVSFTGFKHSAGGDSLVVLRPRLEPAMKARAIARAFHVAGRPYDFDFNFLTDASLVCTELVYKAYEGENGLAFPLITIMGRPVLPANNIARQFDEEYEEQARQLDFIAFYDGDEWTQQAVEADVTAFMASSLRPKWHIFLPSAATASGAAATAMRK